ncbi:MAG: ABC transporter ATP-binding protein [Hyphomicrobiales bacterium]|nr:ABC transporter ATP-binding protein [Hyphomicrobiales bacterium]MCP5372203.1 ABC transporter ATP-binding protein [Hyphomicrobiales bacterium]
MGDSHRGAGAAVSFRGVTKSYGPVHALADFNLEIEPGEFITLLGPSGSGKTTALNVLAGFTEATAGDVQIGGRSILALPPERRNVGMVFQSYSLFPHMNVFENVAFPLRLRKVRSEEVRRRVEDCLRMVQLSDYAGRMPKELSGGQRQRVAFARAVVFEPPVLLMDEPLGALDLKLREAMQLEIKRYHGQLGCTIVFVTHDQGEALALSDRIAVMGDGRITQVDSPDRIYDAPNSRYVAEFIGRTNLLDFERAGPGRVRFPALDVEADLPADGAGAWNGGCRCASLRPEKLLRLARPAPGTAVFEATVEEFLFLGDIVHYSMRTPTGALLLLQEHRGPDTPAMRRNDRIRLGFSLADARPVADDGPAGPAPATIPTNNKAEGGSSC